MVNRSCVPVGVKRGIAGKTPNSDKDYPMKFNHGRARKPRPDTGKKISKGDNDNTIKPKSL